MFGTPDVATALVLMALLGALLLGLVSYHSAGGGYVNWGIGALILATSVALLSRAVTQPGASTGLVLLLVFLTVMMALLTFHSRRWGHAVWWIGVLLFLLTLPLLATGRGDLALFGLIAGPGLLMFVALVQPEIPAQYARLGATDAGPVITEQELTTEQHRYTRLAGAITVLSLAGIWLGGGVPRGPVTEASASGPVVVDEALAGQGRELFSKYGCVACHSITGQAGAGPSLKAIYNRKERMEDGTELVANEAYLRESIVQPDTKTVNGYAKGVMAGAISPNLPEIRQPSNLNALVEYVKSLR